MVIVITQSSGVSIMRMPEGEDVAVEIAKFRGVHLDYVSHKEVEESDIPTDRTFRNALKDDLTIDMSKAREIHKEKLRRLRGPLLAALDVAYQRADEENDQTKKDEIAAKKDALRDVTNDPAIDSAQTPEELKAVIPEVLKGGKP